MTLNIRPILSALLRNRTGAVLVALQIAFALAILVNAAYIVKQRFDTIRRPTGIDDTNTFVIDPAGFTPRYDYASSVRDDLDYLHGLNGVVDATVAGSAPLSGSGGSSAFYRAPGRKPSDQVESFILEADEHALQTLGTHLIAGRFFRKEEIMPPLRAEDMERAFPVAVVDQEFARALFPPDGNALGKVFYDFYGRPVTIIGITANVLGPWTGVDYQWRLCFVPRQPLLFGYHYVVRTQPGRRDEIMRIAGEHLAQSNADRVIRSVRSIALYKKALFLPERITVIFLVVVTGVLLAVAALGIFGLATFNVSTRTKQIGTRRAVGARMRDIIRHFMVENGLVTTAGIVMGCALALAVGYVLSVYYEFARLDLYYLVGGVLVFWALGQLAAWQPARRAATVPPSVATRTV